MSMQVPQPFYERVTRGFSIPAIGKAGISLLLGLLFLILHYLSVGQKVFQDWSWFLSILIATAMLTLHYATHTLQTLLPEIHRLGENAEKVCTHRLQGLLTDRNFVSWGSFFGVFNCFCGYLFGLPDNRVFGIVTILIGYFLAGFVCGMAVLGIYASSVSLSAISRNSKLSFDFSSPDRCGGTTFIGEALVVFGVATLVVGVMISIYILEAPWTNVDTAWVSALKWLWIAFPYLTSLAVFLVPAVPLNKALREYKSREEDMLRDHLNSIRTRLEDDRVSPAQRKELREEYEFHMKSRQDLHRMRTWPYGLGANLTYLVIFVSHVFVSVQSITDWLSKKPPHL